MPIIEITSLSDPGIQIFSTLTEAQLRMEPEPEKGLFIAESPKVIRVALDAGWEPVALLCERKHIEGDAKDIIERLDSRIPIYTGSRELLASLTGYTLTRGVLCAMRRKQMPSVSEVLRDARRVVVIEGVTDTTNIGAIFRSAAALGIDAVILTRDTCDPLNRRAVRVSMGSVFLIPWTWLDAPIESLHNEGFKTVAMALTDDSITLDDPVLNTEPRLAIIMGTEGDGLPKKTITEADYVIRIPMSRKVDSLNVAAAAAVAFWQLCKRTLLLLAMLLPMVSQAQNSIIDPNIKSLQVVVNQDWLSPAVMRLNSDDVLHIAFDELSHNYHRYICHLEHCEADWSPSEGLFESDWLESFNDMPIEDYANSINTTVVYTHYNLQIPNEQCRLKMSGNYKLHILDEDNDNAEVLVAAFMVTEQSMRVGLSVTSNTDIDTNVSHQQVSMSLNYGSVIVTNPDEQIKTVVMQNGRTDNMKLNVRYNGQHFNNGSGLDWTHHRGLIFDAGNEYHKFEILDVSHPTMGIDFIRWDGQYYQASPFISEPRLNYLYDEDANGAFYIRNSDNIENDISSDYVWVNYRLKAPRLTEGNIIIDGQWTTDNDARHYMMTYDEETGLYTARILQKLGYYSYQYLWLKEDGTTAILPSEGNFYQTENRYQALVYFKGSSERTWRLTAYQQVILK